MVKRLVVGIIVVLLLAVVAVWRAPASLVDRWLQSNQHDLDLNLTSGTIWNGHAESAIWRGVRLGELSWAVEKIRSDQFDIRFTSNGRQSEFAGLLSLQGEDWVAGQNLVGKMPANWLDISQFMPFVRLNGELEWDVAQFRLPASQPPAGVPGADGQIVWYTASLSGLARATLGDIILNLAPGEDGLSVLISSVDSGQDVRVSGDLRSDGTSYSVDLLLAIAPDRPDIAQQLSPYGEFQQDGRFRMRFNGALFPETAP